MPSGADCIANHDYVQQRMVSFDAATHGNWHSLPLWCIHTCLFSTSRLTKLKAICIQLLPGNAFAFSKEYLEYVCPGCIDRWEARTNSQQLVPSTRISQVKDPVIKSTCSICSTSRDKDKQPYVEIVRGLLSISTSSWYELHCACAAGNAELVKALLGMTKHQACSRGSNVGEAREAGCISKADERLQTAANITSKHTSANISSFSGRPCRSTSVVGFESEGQVTSVVACCGNLELDWRLAQ
jgi:hypothetical protein